MSVKNIRYFLYMCEIFGIFRGFYGTKRCIYNPFIHFLSMDLKTKTVVIFEWFRLEHRLKFDLFSKMTHGSLLMIKWKKV